MIVPKSLIILTLAAIVSAQDTTIPTIPSMNANENDMSSEGDFTMPSFPAMPGMDESSPTGSSSTSSNANAVCCNVKMGGNCPSGLNAALGGTLIGAGGVLTSCCPSGVNNMNANGPSCDGFVVKDVSGGSAQTSPSSSSGGSGVCSDEIANQFSTCDTCVYSCGDGEEKKCSLGLAGNCITNCFGGGVMTTCTVPGASSGGGMDMDLPFDNMNSSIKKDRIGIIVFGMIWAIGHGIMQY